jgi:hypothetical protein
MSKDDVGPKRPPREEDPSYITMPPELRAYDTGPLEDTAIKPGDDPILDAAVAGIRVLDGDPNADPFYYDVRKRRAEAKKNQGAGAGNVATYVAPTGLPSSSEVKAADAAPAKVVIAELDDPLSTRAIDVRAFRGKSEVARRMTGGEGNEPAVDRGEAPAGDASVTQPESPHSPWSKEAPTPEAVRASALPSSLRPRELPAPSGEKPTATPDRSRTKVVLTLAVVIVALGVGALVLTTKAPESGSQPPPPTATTTPILPAVRPPVPAPSPSTVPVAPPPVSSSGTVGLAAPPSTAAASEPQRPAPKPSSTAYDPYADAAVAPLPAVTAQPSAAPTVAPTTQPAIGPKAPPTATSARPAPVSTSGRIVGGEE